MLPKKALDNSWWEEKESPLAFLRRKKKPRKKRATIANKVYGCLQRFFKLFQNKLTSFTSDESIRHSPVSRQARANCIVIDNTAFCIDATNTRPTWAGTLLIDASQVLPTLWVHKAFRTAVGRISNIISQTCAHANTSDFFEICVRSTPVSIAGFSLFFNRFNHCKYRMNTFALKKLLGFASYQFSCIQWRDFQCILANNRNEEHDFAHCKLHSSHTILGRDLHISGCCRPCC